MKYNNILKLPIDNIAFKFIDRKTVCVITYWNSILQRWCKSKGIALCHPDDKFDFKLGEHIAESRAKRNMYETYLYSAMFDYYHKIELKYGNLIRQEEKHLNELINKKQDG